MAKLLDWDKFAMIYGENFSTTMGAKGINALVVIGALIIKHVEVKDDRGERNHIEGKFGQGKTKYKLNNIMAKLANTNESWIAAIFFVMNILKLSKDYLFALFYWLFLNEFYSYDSAKSKLKLINCSF